MELWKVVEIEWARGMATDENGGCTIPEEVEYMHSE